MLRSLKKPGRPKVNPTWTYVKRFYKMDKHNMYWPIPNSAIIGNNKGQLAQNYGYDGYDENTPMWETWEEAVADEDRTE